MLEAADLGFCLRLLQVANHIVCHAGAEHLTEIAATASTHPKHGFRLLIFVSYGRSEAITSMEHEHCRNACCVWPLLAMQAKTYSARACVG